MFTSKWGLEVQPEDIVSYFNERHKIDATVEIITTKVTDYLCYKVSFLIDDIDKSYDTTFWPKNIAYRKFQLRKMGGPGTVPNGKKTMPISQVDNTSKSPNNVLNNSSVRKNSASEVIC